jgi:NADPH:quinone reductase-like Zn-dependent oxidoreductase
MDRVGGWLERVLDLYHEGVVQPVIAERFSLDEAARAHHYIQDRKNIGKVVLLPDT